MTLEAYIGTAQPGGRGAPGAYECIIIGASGYERERGGAVFQETDNERLLLYAVLWGISHMPDGIEGICFYTDETSFAEKISEKWREGPNTGLWTQVIEMLHQSESRVKPVDVTKSRMALWTNICRGRAEETLAKSTDRLIDVGFVSTDQSAMIRPETTEKASSSPVDIDNEEQEEKDVRELQDVFCYVPKDAGFGRPSAAIEKFNQQKEHTFEEYAALRVGGRDAWSGTRKAVLESFVEEQYRQAVRRRYEDDARYYRCLRWFCRGLSLWDAMEKTAADEKWVVTHKGRNGGAC